MAEGLKCRLCLHEFPMTGGEAHIDLFVRAAWRVAALDTFEVSAEFLPVLRSFLEGPPATESSVHLRILPGDSRPAAGFPGVWRAARKADHRLKYWNHTGPIEAAEAGGADRGYLRELARGILEGPLPSVPASGFYFQLGAG